MQMTKKNVSLPLEQADQTKINKQSVCKCIPCTDTSLLVAESPPPLKNVCRLLLHVSLALSKFKRESFSDVSKNAAFGPCTCRNP